MIRSENKPRLLSQINSTRSKHEKCVLFLLSSPDILKQGGNAADAAVAIAAALAVTEPCSTGPGGDAFCLFYNGNTGEIRGINGRW